MKLTRFFSHSLFACTVFGLACSPALLLADEWEESTPYYEDDAWYDISEWFDGNDYNPTDEAIGRWDDETYDVSDAVTSSDQDNDVDWSTSKYGYYDSDNDDNDWYYDYYDYGYTDYGDYNSDNAFDYTASYYDYDGDGLYDAYASYWDSDGDGIYDDISYYTFANVSSSNTEGANKNEADAESKQKSKQVKTTSFTGTIKSAKKVKTPVSTNVVVQLADSSSDKTMIVDLGPAKDFETMPRLGQSMTAQGVMYKAGDKKILVAQKLERNGTLERVDRSGHSYTGTVEKTMKSKVRDQDHQLVKFKTDKGKNLLVDMGPAKNLTAKISEGSEITVKGPAVKVKDRVMLVATEVEMNGKTTDIKRVAAK